MLLALLALILLFVGFPLVLRSYHSASEVGITDEERRPWKAALIAPGALGFGIIGILAGIALTFVIGVMLMGTHVIDRRASGETIANSIVLVVALLFACAGAALGFGAERWIARRASPRPAPDAR